VIRAAGNTHCRETPWDPTARSTGDNSGGVLGLDESQTGSIGLADFNGQTGQVRWQYLPPNGPGALWSPAVGRDGTIYALDDDYPQNGAGIDAIDANGGSVISQTPLPTTTTSDTLNTPVYQPLPGGGQQLLGYYYCYEPSYYFPTPQGNSGSSDGLTSSLAIGSDGTVYVENWTHQETSTDTASPDGSSCTDAGTISETLSLVTLSPGGGSQNQQLATFSTTWSNTYCSTCSQSAFNLTEHTPVDVIPDGRGGALTAWETWQCSSTTGSFSNCTESTATMADIGPQGVVQADFSSLHMSSVGDNLVLGGDGTAFVTDGASVISFNTSTLPVGHRRRLGVQRGLPRLVSPALSECPGADRGLGLVC